MQPVIFAEALNVEAAISAAAAGGLARGLMLAALAVVFVAAVRVLASKVLTRKSTSSLLAEAQTGLPAPVVLISASAVGLIGSVIGFVSAWTNRSILIGDSFVGVISSGLGLWSTLALILFGLVIAVASLLSSTKKSNPVLSLIGFGSSLALAFGLVLSGDLPRPPSSANALATYSDTVTATAVLTPGAVGPNSLRVGLSGPDEEVELIRQVVSSGNASVTLVSLELDTRTEPKALTLDDQGALFAEDLVAEGPGRWRIQVDLGADTDLLILDVTLSPNPAHNRGTN